MPIPEKIKNDLTSGVKNWLKNANPLPKIPINSYFTRLEEFDKLDKKHYFNALIDDLKDANIDFPIGKEEIFREELKRQIWDYQIRSSKN